jgi:hypothetical protein
MERAILQVDVCKVRKAICMGKKRGGKSELLIWCDRELFLILEDSRFAVDLKVVKYKSLYLGPIPGYCRKETDSG